MPTGSGSLMEEPHSPLHPGLPAMLPEDPSLTFRGPDLPPVQEFLANKLASLLDTAAMFAAQPDEAQTRSFAGIPSALGNTLPDSLFVVGKGYAPVRLLAVGGMGEVWEAEQRSLRRPIAIKKLRDTVLEEQSRGRSIGELQWQYCWQEAFIAAHLDHPNILPVYDVALNDQGQLVIAMKRVEGLPWSRVITQDWGTLSVEDFLNKHVPILMQVAQAVAFAHSRAVVHRDLKPGQVIIGRYGEVLLLDWGLALPVHPEKLPGIWKPEQAPLPEMQWFAQSPAGTPAYMAPEQTLRTVDETGPWTDVFLLGGMLYTLLTLKAPNQGTSEMAFSRASRGLWTPLAVAAEGRFVPEELARLMEECLTPDWRQRQITAAMFRDRLEAFRSGQARHRRSAELCREVEKHLLHEPAADYRFFTARLAELDEARTLWPDNPAVTGLRDRTLGAYGNLALAHQDLRLAEVVSDVVQDPTLRQILLQRVAEETEKQNQREKQRRRARLAAMGLLVVFMGATGVAYWQRNEAVEQRQQTQEALRQAQASEALALEEGERAEKETYYASIGYAMASLQDLNLRQAQQTLERAPHELRGWEWRYLSARLHPEQIVFSAPHPLLAVVWHPDGQRFAIGGEHRYLTLVGRDGQEIRRFQGHSDKIYSISFSPNGKLMASASKDRTAMVWDVETGEVVKRFTGHKDFVYTAQFHPKDPFLFLTASREGEARLWDMTSETFEVIHQGEGRLRNSTFSPSGQFIALAGRDKGLSLIDTATRQRLWMAPNPVGVFLANAAFSPDESVVAATTQQGLINLHDTKTGALLRTLNGHKDEVSHAIFTIDGQRLISVSLDNSISVWDPRTGEQLQALIAHSGSVWGAGLHPDEPFLLSAGGDQAVRQWNLRHLTREFEAAIPAVDLASLATTMTVQIPHTPDVTYASVDVPWRNEPYGGRSGIAMGRYPVNIISGQAVFSRDGRWRVNVGQRPAQLLDAATGAVRGTFAEVPVNDAAFSPDSSRFALAIVYGVSVFQSGSPATKLFSVPAGANETPLNVLWDPRGTRLVALYQQKKPNTTWGFRLFDVPQGHSPGSAPEVLFEHFDDYTRAEAMAFSRDGRYLALGTNKNDTIVVWDLEEKRETMRLEGHSEFVHSLDFAPDGTRLASTARDGTIRLWDLAAGREVLAFPRSRPGHLYNAVRFSDDGQRLYAPTSDGMVDVFEAPVEE